MDQGNEAILRRAVEAFNDHGRRAQYLELYASDVVLHGYPEQIHGADGARGFYSEVWNAFPDAELSLEQIVASGDTVAARFTLSGLHAEDFYGAPASGRDVIIDGIAMMRFSDGKVVEEWQASSNVRDLTRLAARAAGAAQPPARTSASAEAAALRLEERESGV
jgi:steroid delta-isomerase-like uncharacterized protein